VRNLLGAGASTDVEEVRGHASGILDDVHRGHGEAGAVHHAADIAVELDVVQAVLRSLDFERIFFGDVTQFAEISVAEKSVVVEVDLGVESEEATVGRRDEGINLEQRSVRIQECLIEAGEELDCGRDLLRAKAEFERDLAGLESLEGTKRFILSRAFGRRATTFGRIAPS
jgi:hypothetical protein